MRYPGAEVTHHMGCCDLCNADIGPQFRRVSPSQFREAVRNGLRPRGMAASVSVSLGLDNSAWIPMAMQSETDWALCPECSAAFDEHSYGHKTSIHSGATRIAVPRAAQPRRTVVRPRQPAAAVQRAAAAQSVSRPCPIKVVRGWKIPFFVLFTLGFYNVFWLYRVFKELHSRKATDLSPGKAVGLLFIPVFNLGWIFFVWKKLGDAITAAYSQAGLPSPATGIAWLAPISFYLAIVFNLAAPPLGIAAGIVFLSIALCTLQGQMNRLAAQAAPTQASAPQPNAVLSQAQFCTKCGTPTAQGGRFCANCGSSLSPEEPNAGTKVKQADCIGMRFDIGKIGSGAYGEECWKVFWRAVDTSIVAGAQLLDGDTSGTPDTENVYCVAIQWPAGAGRGDDVRKALEESEHYVRVASAPSAIDAMQVSREPLVNDGRVDASGRIVGTSYRALPALEKVTKERSQNQGPS